MRIVRIGYTVEVNSKAPVHQWHSSTDCAQLIYVRHDGVNAGKLVYDVRREVGKLKVTKSRNKSYESTACSSTNTPESTLDSTGPEPHSNPVGVTAAVKINDVGLQDMSCLNLVSMSNENLDLW